MSIIYQGLNRKNSEKLVDYDNRINGYEPILVGYAYFGPCGYHGQTATYGLYIVWNGEINSKLKNPHPEYGYAIECDKDAAIKLYTSMQGVGIYGKLESYRGKIVIPSMNIRVDDKEYSVSYIGMSVAKPDNVCFQNMTCQDDMGALVSEASDVNCVSGSYSISSLNPGSFNPGSFNLGSFNLASFELSSFNLGSFNITAFETGSFNLGSFSLSSFNLGSFNLGSFNLSSFNLAGFNFGSFNLSSFNLGSFNLSSFSLGSFNLGSFNLGSFNLGSFNLWNFNLGSFNLGSFSLSGFNLGSFNISSFNLGSFNLEAFNLGSFNLGSFDIGSFNLESFNFGSYNLDSFNSGSFNSGSFNLNEFNFEATGGSVADDNRRGSGLPFKTSLRPEEFDMQSFYKDVFGIGFLGYGLNLI